MPVIDAQDDSNEARDRARAALRAALAAAADRALAERVPPEALIRHVEERISELRRTVAGHDGDGSEQDSSTGG